MNTADQPHSLFLAALNDQLNSRTEEFVDAGRLRGPGTAALGRGMVGSLEGGKRTRPLLAEAAFGSYEKADDSSRSQLVHLGAALEFFQAHALIHDDLIDHSSSRRGRPAAHLALARDFQDLNLGGDLSDLGAGSSILLGDLALACAFREVGDATAGLDSHLGHRIRDEFADMVRRVLLGQYYDTVSPHEPWPEPTAIGDHALDIIDAKTVPYSTLYPLRLGALLGGLNESALGSLWAAGTALGRAYQLRDDDLGVFGDPSVTGKPAGGDIREGKRTVLVGLTLERVSSFEAVRLKEILDGNNPPDAAVEYAKSLMVTSGARGAHEALIDNFSGQARMEIANSALPECRREILTGLVEELTHRVS